jgi:hypothetical protein
VAQVVEHLPSKHEALSSNHGTEKKKAAEKAFACKQCRKIFIFK